MMSNSNSKPEKNGALIDFLSNVLTGNFKKLVLINLLLDIPLVIIAGIIALISYLLGGIYIFVVMLVIPLLAPFSAGVFYIVRNIAKGEKIKIAEQFKRGVKDNAFQFFIQGIIHYLVFTGFYVAFEFYRNDLSNPLIISALVASIIVALIYLFMTFNMGMMTVTVKLKSIDIFKNSLLLSFMAIVQNVKTLLAMLFIFALIFSVTILISDMTIVVCVLVALILIILPTLIFLIIGYNSYPAIKDFVIDSKTEKKPQEEKKVMLPQLTAEELEEYAEGDPNEYVYVDGKMVKRATVLKMLEKLKQNNE